MPRPFLACYLREPLTLELGLQGNMEEVSVSGCEECACRRLAQSVRGGGGEGRGSAQPLPGEPAHIPALYVTLACSPHRVSTQHSHRTLVCRILGKFMFWIEVLLWLGLRAPPSRVALGSTSEGQHLPGCWASGWRVWRPPGPEPPAQPALHPRLSEPTAAEFNAGSGCVPDL